MEISKNKYTTQDIIDTANTCRGQIIGAICELEMIMDLAISFYFTNKSIQKAKELRYALISSGSFNFNTKIFLIGFILIRYPEFKKKNKSIDDGLSQIVMIRNVVAHQMVSVLDSDLESYDGHIVNYTLITTDKKIEKIKTTKMDKHLIKEHLDRIKNVANRVARLCEVVVKSQTAS